MKVISRLGKIFSLNLGNYSDKKLRFYERRYSRDRNVEIESFEKNNPQQFWGQSLKTNNKKSNVPRPTVIKAHDGSVITYHNDDMTSG